MRDELEAVPDPGGTAAAGERAPEQVVAAFFDAFGRHDVEAIRRLLTDDIVEELSGTSPIEGIENECAFLTGRRDATNGRRRTRRRRLEATGNLRR
jgi:limonene-1,2-epoxide hydrolase